MRRRDVMLALVGGTAAALLVTRDSLRDAWASLRRSSAPGAGCYELLAGSLLRPFYRRVADEVVAACPAGTILEVGPGPGHLAEAIGRRAGEVRIVGVDVDPAMVARAAGRARRAGLEDRVSFVVGDVAALPVPDRSVDLIVSTFSFHHWQERRAGLEEIGRVLRPGGLALLFDLHRSWVRFETGGEDVATAVLGSWPGRVVVTPVGRLLGVPLVVRVELEKRESASRELTS